MQFWTAKNGYQGTGPVSNIRSGFSLALLRRHCRMASDLSMMAY